MSAQGQEARPLPVLYLAGGINKLSDNEAMGWRGIATRRLEHRFTILDPMARDYRGMEDMNVDAIVLGDLADIDSADVLLVRAEQPSWGTAMEVHYAHTIGKRIVAFGVGDGASPWLKYHTTLIVSTLDLATTHLLYG